MSKIDEIFAAEFRRNGYEYTAQYVEKFGMEKWEPSFRRGANQETEDFYKKCVEEGHPWDYYRKYSGKEIF